jgi:uncharacterized protein (TIGR01777 family)
MRFVLAGSSGFLGTALRDRLARDGHEVFRLVRGDTGTPTESHWDPSAGLVDADLLAAADVVVNLAGAPLIHWPWTQAYRRTLERSRTTSTATLTGAIARSGATPVLLSGSGIDAYGSRGDEVLTEESSRGSTFLAGVVRAWEGATTPAVEAGCRVVTLRTGMVLDARGGALRLLQLPFRLGVGGPMGSGARWMSVISLDDWVSAVVWLATCTEATGPHNLVAPEPVTSADFAATMGRVLYRPSAIPVPATPARLVLGAMSELALGSLRVRPAALQREGFTWSHPDLESVLRGTFGR